MARPVKHNLEYFPLDVSFFESHKMLLIEEDCGVKGGYLALRLMAMVYEKEGYFLEWKDKFELSCAKRVGNGYTGALVNEILKSCLRHGLFSKEMFDQHRILTSSGIQERWLKVMRDLRRKVEIDPNFLLVKEEEIGVSSEETQDSPEETPAPGTFSTQKESKGNDSKVKETKSNLPPESGKQKKGRAVPGNPAPPKNGSEKGEQKIKDGEPYWDLLVKVWFDFNFEKFKDRPSFSGPDPRYLKKIIEKLKKRAVAKKVMWNEITGPERLTTFLSAAFSDAWLCKHFLLKNLNEQFDTIIMQQKKASAGERNGPKVNGHSVPRSFNQELEYLTARYIEGELDGRLITDDLFQKMQARDLLPLDTGAITLDQKRQVVLKYFEKQKEKTYAS